VTSSQEDGCWPHADLQFGWFSGDQRLGIVAGTARRRAGRIIGTFSRIHLLAADCPEFTLVQISDVAIGTDVFQISEKCAVRRCGSDFEDQYRRA
jgi:hypothetical protein